MKTRTIFIFLIIGCLLFAWGCKKSETDIESKPKSAEVSIEDAKQAVEEINEKNMYEELKKIEKEMAGEVAIDLEE